jgi:hypothetical protein
VLIIGGGKWFGNEAVLGFEKKGEENDIPAERGMTRKEKNS